MRQRIFILVLGILVIASGMIGWFFRGYSMKPPERSEYPDYIVTSDNAKATIEQAIHEVVGDNKTVVVLAGDYGLSQQDVFDLGDIAIANNVSLVFKFAGAMK